ncbi:MAG TPA: endolytic transglycosylase MltG, partial [Thermoanaerobaculia bacterium]|nr:endolytic transglycosylase MltG [Thermoanaerobaculia bacterium]
GEPVRPPAREPVRRTVRELVTLASLVEEEAKVEDERPLIAAVYANRLERGMGLYADPTVIYALKRAGRWDGNIRREDLRLDSPYNTYRHAGLPPGPIASPGLASLRAAAAPAPIEALYFVSRNDGTHVFADTLAEHNRNVDRWQRRYWREQRRQGAAGGARSPAGAERQVDRE